MGVARGVARPVVATVAVACLAACGLPLSQDDTAATVGEPGTGTGAASSAPGAVSTTDAGTTYRVPQAACPRGWRGLSVASGPASRAPTGVVACSDASGTTTYLENRSLATWLLDVDAAAASTIWRVDEGLAEVSFLQVARSARSREPMVPGAKLTIDVPPDQVSWDLDLPLSFAWETHRLITGLLLSDFGPLAMSKALTRHSRAGFALARCSVAVDDFAASVDGLDQVEPTSVVLTGLGSSSSAASRCRTAASQAHLRDPGTGEVVTMAGRLDQLGSRTGLLTSTRTRLTRAATYWRALHGGMHLVATAG